MNGRRSIIATHCCIKGTFEHRHVALASKSMFNRPWSLNARGAETAKHNGHRTM